MLAACSDLWWPVVRWRMARAQVGDAERGCRVARRQWCARSSGRLCNDAVAGHETAPCLATGIAGQPAILCMGSMAHTATLVQRNGKSGWCKPAHGRVWLLLVARAACGAVPWAGGISTTCTEATRRRPAACRWAVLGRAYTGACNSVYERGAVPWRPVSSWLAGCRVVVWRAILCRWVAD